jgi:hypothetical protein
MKTRKLDESISYASYSIKYRSNHFAQPSNEAIRVKREDSQSSDFKMRKGAENKKVLLLSKSGDTSRKSARQIVFHKLDLENIRIGGRAGHFEDNKFIVKSRNKEDQAYHQTNYLHMDHRHSNHHFYSRTEMKMKSKKQSEARERWNEHSHLLPDRGQKVPI